MDNKNFFDASRFRAKMGEHRGKTVIWIAVPNDRESLKQFRLLFKPHYSVTQKSWFLPDTKNNRAAFAIAGKTIGKEAFTKISNTNAAEFQKFQELMILKGLSPNTQRTYCSEFAQLLHILNEVPVQNLSEDKIRSYILYCHVQLKLSENQIHSRMNALKFYFEKVLGREKIFLNIPRPKKHLKLPKTLNPSEITKMILVTENVKHRLIIKLGYGLGLRVSEIVNLKIEDIDSVEMRVLIERSKGKKDRYVNLPDSVLDDLRVYYREFKPKNYLFEGADGGRYSERSAQNAFKTAMKKAGVFKNVGIHALRHSYATHLLQYGTDISLIQKLLGHNSIKTTLIYTDVTDGDISRVGSPLDRLKEPKILLGCSNGSPFIKDSDCGNRSEFSNISVGFDSKFKKSSRFLNVDGNLFRISLYSA